jgi:threonyl-tRNA synthetase
MARPENYLGSPETWVKAEQQLRDLVGERSVDAPEAIGEAAFYGPKIDFIGKDSLGRQWQLATIQLDMNMPERFDLTCTNEKGEKERIVMIHAAIMGSIERFLSNIIEHFGGAFPVWLAPEQVRIASVAEDYLGFASELASQLRGAGIRVELDSSNESVGKKIRAAEVMKIPYTIVVGEKEASGGDLAVRIRGQKDLWTCSIQEFVAKVASQVAERSLS